MLEVAVLLPQQGTVLIQRFHVRWTKALAQLFCGDAKAFEISRCGDEFCLEILKGVQLLLGLGESAMSGVEGSAQCLTHFLEGGSDLARLLHMAIVQSERKDKYSM